MPGLADMHVHLKSLTFSEMNTLFVANGVTTVRSMAGRPAFLSFGARLTKVACSVRRFTRQDPSPKDGYLIRHDLV